MILIITICIKIYLGNSYYVGISYVVKNKCEKVLL